MSYLRKLPDFVRARELANGCKWKAAAADFYRACDIMRHANQVNESTLAHLYAGTCELYAGNTQRCVDVFSSVNPRTTSSRAMESCTERFRLAASVQLHLETDCMIPQSDSVWWRLGSGDKPGTSSDPLAHGICEIIEGRTAEVPDELKLEAEAYSMLIKASNALSKLSVANTEGSELELVNAALKAGKKIRSKTIGSWYIGRSLLMRGQLFEYNGNALMAEAMYSAARDVTISAEVADTARIRILRKMACNSLGDLLLKWEKREPVGAKLKALNQVPVDKETLERAINFFVPEPTLEQLDILDV